MALNSQNVVVESQTYVQVIIDHCQGAAHLVPHAQSWSSMRAKPEEYSNTCVHTHVLRYIDAHRNTHTHKCNLFNDSSLKYIVVWGNGCICEYTCESVHVSTYVNACLCISWSMYISCFMWRKAFNFLLIFPYVNSG